MNLNENYNLTYEREASNKIINVKTHYITSYSNASNYKKKLIEFS